MSLWDKAWPGPSIRLGEPLGAAPLGEEGKVPPEFLPPEVSEAIEAGGAAAEAAAAAASDAIVATEAAADAASDAIAAAAAQTAAEAAASTVTSLNLSGRSELPDGLYVTDGDDNIAAFFGFDTYYCPPIAGAIAAVSGQLSSLGLTVRDEIPDGSYIVDQNDNVVSFISATDPAANYPVVGAGSDLTALTEEVAAIRGRKAFNLGLRARVNYGVCYGESTADNVSTGQSVFTALYLAENGVALSSLNQEMTSGFVNHPGHTMLELMDADVILDDHTDIDNKCAAALAAGKSFAVGHIGLMMDVNDYIAGTSPALYKTQTYTFMDEREAYIAQATGIAEPPVWVRPLCCTFVKQGKPDPYLMTATLETAQERDNIVISCTTYQFDYPDGTHPDTPSARIISAYNFMAHKRTVIDGIKYHPTEYTAGSGFVQNKVLSGSGDKQSVWVGHFTAPVLPLDFDTTIVTNFADAMYGFRAFDALGAQLTITSVIVVGLDQLQVTALTASGDPSDGQIATLDYAMAADVGATGADLSGHVTGARGCLCDSTTTSFTTGMTTRVLKSFCIPFTFSI